MFTGIVAGCGNVISTTCSHGYKELIIEAPKEIIQSCDIGASIAVDGVCLTVKDIKLNSVAFDVGAETRRLTIADEYKVGQRVNLERSLKIGDEIGGHILSGHVDGIGKVLSISSDLGNTILKIAAPLGLYKYIFLKGYVAVNGVSLTINELHIPGILYESDNGTSAQKKADGDNYGFFTCHLVPETLKRTNLSCLLCGSLVNLEISRQDQVLVDTTLRWLEHHRDAFHFSNFNMQAIINSV